MPALKFGAEGHICRSIAIVTDLASCVPVLMYVQRFSSGPETELSVSSGPKFTRKDWEHMQQSTWLQRFHESFQRVTRQLPYTALVTSKGISHVWNHLRVSISRQTSSDLFFLGSYTGGISPLLLSPVPFFLPAV